jgi:hypothetical protein
VRHLHEGIHPGFRCDRSGVKPIVGIRYSLPGKDYDLCQAEFDKLPADEKALYDAHPPPVSRREGGGFREGAREQRRDMGGGPPLRNAAEMDVGGRSGMQERFASVAPDEKAMVEHLASFRLRHGEGFEEMVREKHRGDPRFAFLFERGSLAHAYYEHVVAERAAEAARGR